MDDAKFIRDMAMANNRYFGNFLPMIASENLPSPLAEEMLISDLGHRYAEGKPGERYYQGCRYIDEIEKKVVEMGKKLFRCEYINPQVVSGTVANLAVFSAFGKSGDTLTALTRAAGRT